ncbi:MAG: 3-hydroxyacyl-CoA dehydrogenase/enoyl-CoA hydratase family protein [Longimicrobiales bacterium]|nr:3-hydroxyacyl-CoA dehydrogenase/enoyl-CoA hydratase family protein [Longimicrobiales bacterium]
MRIKKLGVVGAGVMGSGITGIAASAGIPVLLLDVPGDDERNGPAKKGLEKALKGSAFPDPDRRSLVEIGNVEDDLERLAGCDWIVEAIVEKPGPKRELFEKLEGIVSDDAIVSSNTSAIPMSVLIEGRSDGFRERFLGTHFFNPVRYMHLLEVIPTPATDGAVVETMESFADLVLGKGVVLTKDAPGFIANRLGLKGVVEAIRLMERHDLDIDEVDALTGPLMGRSRSAIFRTTDIAGLDILVDAVTGMRETTGEDLPLPDWIHDMVDRGDLGSKSGQGFYRKEKDGEIKVLDWRTGEYGSRTGELSDELKELEGAPLEDRLRGLADAGGSQGDFARDFFARTFHYTADKAAELAYDLPSVDRAMEWGYAWQAGPFLQMDHIGLARVRELISDEGLDEPSLLEEAGEAFYRWGEGEAGGAMVLALTGGDREPVPEDPGTVSAAALHRQSRVLTENEVSALLDMGDGVALFELRSKMGTLGARVMDSIRAALEKVEEDGLAGMVIGKDQGDRPVFSAGANLQELLENARKKNFDQVDAQIAAFQDTLMAVRDAPFPVVTAAFGTTVAGGAEVCLHSDQVQAHTELRIGLVEFGVGLIPAGGGTKELLFRFTEELSRYAEDELDKAVREAFTLIGMATVSNSAADARKKGFIRDRDRVTANQDRLLADAKTSVLQLAPGYVAPPRRTIRAVGERGIGNLHVTAFSMREAGRMSEHDDRIARELAYVLCGGDGDPRTVTERDILELEREAFLRLLGTEGTQERIEHMLKTGKPLRN